ncbi:MAG: hypothetical protein WBM02_12280 [bacterium]
MFRQRKGLLMVILLFCTSNAVADVMINGYVFLDDSCVHSGIDVRMYVYNDPTPPTPTACNHSPIPKNQEDRIHEHDQVN